VPGDSGPPQIRVLAYGPDDWVEEEVTEVAALAAYRESWPVVWVDVTSVGDESMLQALQELFGLHRLALEDVVNLGQRAKVEPYDEHLFIVVRAPAHCSGGEHDTESEQVSLFVGHGFILTFQERPGDCFVPVRERVRTGKGIIRRAGADYLAYALVDATVDAYFPVLERLGERLEELEDKVVLEPDQSIVREIHAARSDLLNLRRTVWPHRDAINSLLREGAPFIQEETTVYLRDCYDHAVRIIDLVETYREISSDLMSTYLSSLSNRMNEVMKVLTMIATIFIPLSFLAGLYGMNFDTRSPWNMPELGWAYGYPAVLGLMVVIAVGFVVYFQRKGWFR
jgi:magnesium transporter